MKTLSAHFGRCEALPAKFQARVDGIGLRTGPLAVKDDECQDSRALGHQADKEGDRVPTYQYICNDCGESHEAVQKFSDDALTECPACGGKLRKVYSAVGVVFKGSGFYRNDSRSTGSSATAGSPGKADAAAPAASSPASATPSTSSSDGSSSTTSTPAPSAAPAATKKTGDSKVA